MKWKDPDELFLLKNGGSLVGKRQRENGCHQREVEGKFTLVFLNEH